MSTTPTPQEAGALPAEVELLILAVMDAASRRAREQEKWSRLKHNEYHEASAACAEAKADLEVAITTALAAARREGIESLRVPTDAMVEAGLADLKCWEPSTEVDERALVTVWLEMFAKAGEPSATTTAEKVATGTMAALAAGLEAISDEPWGEFPSPPPGGSDGE